MCYPAAITVYETVQLDMQALITLVFYRTRISDVIAHYTLVQLLQKTSSQYPLLNT